VSLTFFLTYLTISCATHTQYLRYLSDCIRGEYWDRVLVRHPELRMYNTILKKFEIFQAQVRRHCFHWYCVLCTYVNFCVAQWGF
jgi:hypothetical protein